MLVWTSVKSSQCVKIELNTDVAISPENRKDVGNCLPWKICGFEIDASL